jgi:SAM-dependent methyltransferase
MADPTAEHPFERRLLEIYTGGILTQLIEIGYRTGLFEAAAAGPDTSAGLSERAGLDERYVREWLGAMASAGILTYEPESARFTLPPEHAALLAGDRASNVAPQSRLVNHFGGLLSEIVERFRDGEGLGYERYRPEFTGCEDDTWRRIYDEHLVDGFVAASPGLAERLAAGARVLDLGCGTGHAVNLLAAAYPASSFTGIDIAGDAIAAAREEAAAMGLANARFQQADAAGLPAEPAWDAILAFDAIHDQRDPATVLRRVRQALAEGGRFLMIEFAFSSRLEGNIGNPYAPLYYGFSVLHCMPVSLAGGGAGLGAVWGEERAREMLDEAGFGRVETRPTPRAQNLLFDCRP